MSNQVIPKGAQYYSRYQNTNNQVYLDLVIVSWVYFVFIPREPGQS